MPVNFITVLSAASDRAHFIPPPQLFHHLGAEESCSHRVDAGTGDNWGTRKDGPPLSAAPLGLEETAQPASEPMAKEADMLSPWTRKLLEEPLGPLSEIPEYSLYFPELGFNSTLGWSSSEQVGKPERPRRAGLILGLSLHGSGSQTGTQS